MCTRSMPRTVNYSGARRRVISCSMRPAMERGGMVYAGSDAGNVHALDAENGALLWSSAIDSAVQSSPVVIDGRVYVSSENGYVYALKAWPGE